MSGGSVNFIFHPIIFSRRNWVKGIMAHEDHFQFSSQMWQNGVCKWKDDAEKAYCLFSIPEEIEQNAV